MKYLFIFLFICVLYSCSSRNYHKNTRKMIVEIPNKKIEKLKEIKNQYFGVLS